MAEYAFLIEMLLHGVWQSEIGTRRYVHALEIAKGYRRKVRIIRCYDGEVMWKNHE